MLAHKHINLKSSRLLTLNIPGAAWQEFSANSKPRCCLKSNQKEESKLLQVTKGKGERRPVPSLFIISLSNSSFYLPVCMLHPNLGTRLHIFFLCSAKLPLIVIFIMSSEQLPWQSWCTGTCSSTKSIWSFTGQDLQDWRQTAAYTEARILPCFMPEPQQCHHKNAIQPRDSLANLHGETHQRRPPVTNLQL